MPPKFDMIKKTTRRHSGDDLAVARAYVSKAASSRDRGIEFSISFTSFKNMCRARKCYFTGLELTADTFTIDRVDASKGYITGNVVACHKDFNNLKSMIENPTVALGLEKALKGLNKTKKHIIKNKGE